MIVDRRADQRGVTLVEVLVASVLTLVVLMMGYAILQTTSATARTVTYRAVNSTDARNALTAIEANLRYANAVWVCTADNTTSCSSSPSTTTPATTYGFLVVSNTTSSSNVTQPTCARWSLSGGLAEVKVSGSAVVVAPDVTTALFSLPSTGVAAARLVQVQLTVNSEPSTATHAADAVSVQELVAPDNLPAALGSTTSIGSPTC